MHLILGKNGLFGSTFIKTLNTKHNVICIGRDDFNYYDKDLLFRFTEENNVNTLINASGYAGKPNVDSCETAKYECLLGNAVFPGIIREI